MEQQVASIALAVLERYFANPALFAQAAADRGIAVSQLLAAAIAGGVAERIGG